MLAPGGAALEGDRRVEIEFGQSSIHWRSASPSAWANAASSSLPYFSVTTRQPTALKKSSILLEQALGHDRGRGSGGCSRSPTRRCGRRASSPRAGPRTRCPRRARHRPRSRPCGPWAGPSGSRPRSCRRSWVERREQRHRDAEPDRAGREVDAVGVLGARRIGLGAAERAEALELVARLAAEQVLDGVEHRARVRLDRHPVARPQHVEIERGHQRRDRGAGRLMPADLEPVAARAQMVGVVDHPAREPQHLLLERREILVGAGCSAAPGPRFDGQAPA